MENEKRSKFNFREIVVIKTQDPKKKEMTGKKGYIGGKAFTPKEENNEADRWSYAVSFFDDPKGWCFDEDEMQSTGEFVPENYGKSDLTIRVSQKGEFLGIKDAGDKKDN